MPNKLIQVRFTDAPERDVLREIPELVEKEGGRNLPSPIAYPPTFMIAGTQELSDKLKSTYPKARVNVLQSFDE